MIKYQEVAFTCYAVSNMARARKFYEGRLGLKLSRKFSRNFVEYDVGSGTIAVGCAPDQWKPSKSGTSAVLEVVDFEESLEHLRKNRVKLAIGPLDQPNCSMVAVRDPDGNLITLHKRKSPPRRR